MKLSYLMTGHHGDAPTTHERVNDCFDMKQPCRITCYATHVFTDGERAVLLRGTPRELEGSELELVKEYLNELG